MFNDDAFEALLGSSRDEDVKTATAEVVALALNGEVYELLSEEQLLAIGWLAHGLSNEAVAQKVGVSRETVYRWRNDDAFLALLVSSRREVWQSLHGRLRTIVAQAVAVLERSEAAEVKTALEVLRLAGRYERLLRAIGDGLPR